MSQTTFISDDTALHEASHEAFVGEICLRDQAVLTEEFAARIIAKPSASVEVRAFAKDALAECPAAGIEVRFVRLKRAFICRIKDPGEGFDPAQLQHAAVSNPGDDPLHHASVREELGLRAGGFSILLTSRLLDELVYNERHNELMLVKYLF
jgi:hypothetical protein